MKTFSSGVRRLTPRWLQEAGAGWALPGSTSPEQSKDSVRAWPHCVLS